MKMKRMIKELKKVYPDMNITSWHESPDPESNSVIGIHFVKLSNGNTDIQILGNDVTEELVMEVVADIKRIIGQDRVVNEGWSSGYQNYLK